MSRDSAHFAGNVYFGVSFQAGETNVRGPLNQVYPLGVSPFGGKSTMYIELKKQQEIAKI